MQDKQSQTKKDSPASGSVSKKPYIIKFGSNQRHVGTKKDGPESKPIKVNLGPLASIPYLSIMPHFVKKDKKRPEVENMAANGALTAPKTSSKPSSAKKHEGKTKKRAAVALAESKHDKSASSRELTEGVSKRVRPSASAQTNSSSSKNEGNSLPVAAVGTPREQLWSEVRNASKADSEGKTMQASEVSSQGFWNPTRQSSLDEPGVAAAALLANHFQPNL